MQIFDFINKPIGIFLRFLSELTGGNFSLAILIFTIIINLIMIPLSIKSQKSSAQQTRIKPKVDALKKKYGDDRATLNAETSKLYQAENISTAGGCLPMVVRMLFMMAIYSCITKPLSVIIQVPQDLITKATEMLGELNIKASNYAEINILNHLDALGDTGAQIAAQNTMSFNLFGLNLTETPKFSWNIFGDFQAIWLIPIISFAAAMITSLITTNMQKKLNPDAPNMAGLMLTMPIISLVIAFGVPGAVGLYWIYSSVFSGVIQIIISQIYSPYRIIAADQAKACIKRAQEEKSRMESIDA